MQPSRAQHPHEAPGDLQRVFISLARKRVTPPLPSQKCSPSTRNLGRLESSSRSSNVSHLGQKKSLQLQQKAQLLLNQQSCDGEETRRTAGKTPSPHAGSQGCSITLPYPKPLLSPGHANTQWCSQGCLTLLGPCLPQSPPA